jgi:hypothetical protein
MDNIQNRLTELDFWHGLKNKTLGYLYKHTSISKRHMKTRSSRVNKAHETRLKQVKYAFYDCLKRLNNSKRILSVKMIIKYSESDLVLDNEKMFTDFERFKRKFYAF